MVVETQDVQKMRKALASVSDDENSDNDDEEEVKEDKDDDLSIMQRRLGEASLQPTFSGSKNKIQNMGVSGFLLSDLKSKLQDGDL